MLQVQNIVTYIRIDEVSQCRNLGTKKATFLSPTHPQRQFCNLNGKRKEMERCNSHWSVIILKSC